ncbi:BTAD domain-containing putative transcriptional regulator [Actinoplanes sp. NBRC 103695]|uniref:BTAD domain-containing putative transcriptional regulator n=1 Tax=Actinoplanes sp. NBRC 103695 TaxID=3032202 RepID=UPI0024A2C514|nr:BTAD domain-containing putative transcriptional regulator [Actinoplanes sp. NBRC 103695]GLY97568.1 hypothetical protein Acsp02_48220 [Actinoplanes sp. NBRC 103695]
MEVLLLGPVQLRLDGEIREVGPPQRRHVFAALAVDVGRTVTAETLIDRVWDDAPPDGARRALQSHVARLRALLVSRTDGPARLLHRSGGYRLDLDAQQVDHLQFRTLVERANDVAVGDERRLSLIGDARALWRGEPLTGLTGRWADGVRHAWRRQYAEATVRWAEAAVRAGRADLVIDGLHQLAIEFPLDETIAGALITASHAGGRTAESLKLFADVRARLGAELGAEPGAKLHRLHEAILRDEEPAGGAVVIRQDQSRPAQLPPDVPVFIARERELAALTAISGRSREGRPGPAVCVVHGAGGVGKSWLVLRWSHAHRHRFPDGQLFVNLRGFDPSGEPLTAGAALLGFLGALACHPVPCPPRPMRGRPCTAP